MLGTTPLRGVSLPMGSYLLLLRHPGMECTRYPVLIERQEHDRARVPIPLCTAAQIGDGFVYVPPGESILGGDDEAYNAKPRHRRWIDGFCLATRETTLDEYRACLDDELRSGRRTAEGAVAYCEWRSRVEGRPISLPTGDEWERAARGADGRPFVWGDRFDWTWTRGGNGPQRSRARHPLSPVGSLPSDVTPFGVLDMAGSAREWCGNPPTDFPGLRGFRGGGSYRATTTTFRCANRGVGGPDFTDDDLGFRVRADLRPR